MANADFAFVIIDTELTGSNPSVTKTFEVESDISLPGIGDFPGAPRFENSYLLVTTRNVTGANHQVSINGQPLPRHLPPQEGWATSMARIPAGFLMLGTNTIEIEHTSQDDFYVAFVAIHWREG